MIIAMVTGRRRAIRVGFTEYLPVQVGGLGRPTALTPTRRLALGAGRDRRPWPSPPGRGAGPGRRRPGAAAPSRRRDYATARGRSGDAHRRSLGQVRLVRRGHLIAIVDAAQNLRVLVVGNANGDRRDVRGVVRHD